ncbi:MAG: YceI family protein [Leptospiraceae bacterium]|nr:YceI family protein [Leptospiraceae bacterium]
MNKLLYFLLIAIFSLPVYAETCTYSYDNSQTSVKWIAFKFTERTGVEGSFTKIEVKGSPKGNSLEEFADRVSFKIHTSSVSTKNPERDEKIAKFFFKEMKKTDFIEGSFQNTKIKGKTGTADLILRMNEVEKTVPVQFMIKNRKEIEMKGKIDLLLWKAQNSIDKLNKECNTLHTGKDGKSKLWNDVEISLSTTLKLICK